jgi:hypothetical protein
MGALSLEQLSKAAVMSWPFNLRPSWLAKLIHDLRQQQLDERQQQDCDDVQALAD